MLGIDFRSKIIPVTSRWGSDVRGREEKPIGYVIPLWQPDAGVVLAAVRRGAPDAALGLGEAVGRLGGGADAAAAVVDVDDRAAMAERRLVA